MYSGVSDMFWGCSDSLFQILGCRQTRENVVDDFNFLVDDCLLLTRNFAVSYQSCRREDVKKLLSKTKEIDENTKYVFMADKNMLAQRNYLTLF